MDKLHHELWIVHAINAVLGPIVAAGYRALGMEVPEGQLIPDYLAILLLLSLALVGLGLFVRSRLSVDNPGKLQVLLEDAVHGLHSMLDMLVGPKGRRYVPLIGTVFLIIWLSNMAGLVPGLMAPTSNINVTVGCALLVWFYYHIEGIRAQGLGAYLKHFAMPPGIPAYLAPIMLIIEPISHVARAMSLSLRLFGNVFGEELVILILATLVPFIVPLPMMMLGVLTGTLQAAIFVMLTMIYLGGAVAAEHEHEGQH
ncbi:MAG TPA: F0F1 ATP synthase subunit A [Vicinamibacterales bacterium]|nr:F0F1 ATP synthase subunit A [Vicinamibacterales bacterium]